MLSVLWRNSIVTNVTGKKPGYDAARFFASSKDLKRQTALSKNEDSFVWGGEQSKSNLYHETDRGHLRPSGTPILKKNWNAFQWEDTNEYPHMKFVKSDGKTMIWGKETKPFDTLFKIPHSNMPMKQTNIPFYGRAKAMPIGNYNAFLWKESLVFWIPNLVIFTMILPGLAMLHLNDEVIYTTMTVKIIGRQWYWIYEVESPVDEE
eukprot:Selendium_serpulae@DN6328_c0_g1_i6.p1